MQKECAHCTGRFTAKRASAKYCSDRCRQRAKRAPQQAPERLAGAALIVLPTPPPTAPSTGEDEDGLVATTERELREADRLNTSAGQAAMFLARVLETAGAMQTGSSIASLIREHRAALSKALDGALKTESPLEQLRRARQERRAGATP